MADRTRKALTFFAWIILPLILVAVGVAPGIGNILLVMLGLIWFGFAILIVTPAKD